MTVTPADQTQLADEDHGSLCSRLDEARGTCELIYGTLLDANPQGLSESSESAISALGLLVRELQSLVRDFDQLSRRSVA